MLVTLHKPGGSQPLPPLLAAGVGPWGCGRRQRAGALVSGRGGLRRAEEADGGEHTGGRHLLLLDDPGL